MRQLPAERENCLNRGRGSARRATPICYTPAARSHVLVMRRALLIFAICVQTVAMPVAAQAPPPNLEPVPEPPPEIGLDTSPTGPAVTIQPGPQDRTEEYEIDGRRYVRVVQPNGHEYYLVEDLAQSGLIPSQPGGDRVSVPQWQLMHF
jgi:hypothetical protein